MSATPFSKGTVYPGGMNVVGLGVACMEGETGGAGDEEGASSSGFQQGGPGQAALSRGTGLAAPRAWERVFSFLPSAGGVIKPGTCTGGPVPPAKMSPPRQPLSSRILMVPKSAVQLTHQG